MFKVFGHYQTHPLHKDAKQEFVSRPPPRRMLPPSIPISQPVRSPKFGPLPCPPSSTVLAKHDVLVWFEICELAPNGEYVPAVSYPYLFKSNFSSINFNFLFFISKRLLSIAMIFLAVVYSFCIKAYKDVYA